MVLVAVATGAVEARCELLSGVALEVAQAAGTPVAAHTKIWWMAISFG